MVQRVNLVKLSFSFALTTDSLSNLDPSLSPGLSAAGSGRVSALQLSTPGTQGPQLQRESLFDMWASR